MLLGVGGSDGLFAKLSVTLVTHGLWPARLCSMEFSRQEYWSGLPFPTM